MDNGCGEIIEGKHEQECIRHFFGFRLEPDEKQDRKQDIRHYGSRNLYDIVAFYPKTNFSNKVVETPVKLECFKVKTEAFEKVDPEVRV